MKKSMSMDFEIGSSAVKGSSTKFAKNAWSGHSNDGRLVNYGRGHTVGNNGECGHSGFAHSGKKPPVAGVAGRPANPDSMKFGTQHRGGGKEMPARGKMSFNAGRGPTKGNQQ